MFAHTPLILNQEGKKLSKRDGVTSVSDFQQMGYTAEALANYMTLLGWSPPEGMGERFSLAGGRSSVFLRAGQPRRRSLRLGQAQLAKRPGAARAGPRGPAAAAAAPLGRRGLAG